MKSRTILLGWRALALIASGVLILAGCNSKDAELAAQRQKELEAVRADLEQSKTSAAAQESELTRLRKDNQELLRLRNEIRQVREEKKQLTQQAQTAQAEIQRAQAQAQAVQSQAQAWQALAAQQQAAVARYGAQATPEQQQAHACMNNLRQIDGAKQQWALENKKDANAMPNAKELAVYFKDGVIPKCPAGGTYSFNVVGAAPVCSIPGHALPR
jgi:myosin heavy subunit